MRSPMTAVGSPGRCGGSERARAGNGGLTGALRTRTRRADDAPAREGRRWRRSRVHHARHPRVHGRAVSNRIGWRPRSVTGRHVRAVTRPLRRADADLFEQGRQPVQAAGLRVPVGRDLRRLPLDLRLRPDRRPAAAQREGRVVAVDGAAARRRRRPRRRHPVAARGLGGVGPPGKLHRPAGRLPQLPASGSASTSSTTPTSCPNCGAKGSFTEARAVQPDVQDPRRPGRGRRRRGLPAPRDGAGHVRQLHERARDQPQEAAVRHRPDRQVVPQRDHARATSSSAPASSSRWRWSTSCRPTRAQQVVRVLVRRAAAAGTSTSASPTTSSGCAPTTPTSCRTTRRGTSDVEFLFPWGWDELEGIANRGDYDLTQHAKHSGEKLDYFDQATDERYVPHVIEPAAGATRTMMAFLLAAYDEEEVRGETRTVLRLHHRLAPYKVAVLPLSKKDELTARRPRGARPARSRTSCATTTRPRPSAGATAARTSWARRTASPSTSTRSRPGGHRPRPRLDGAGPGADRRPGRPPARPPGRVTPRRSCARHDGEASLKERCLSSRLAGAGGAWLLWWAGGWWVRAPVVGGAGVKAGRRPPPEGRGLDAGDGRRSSGSSRARRRCGSSSRRGHGRRGSSPVPERSRGRGGSAVGSAAGHPFAAGARAWSGAAAARRAQSLARPPVRGSRRHELAPVAASEPVTPPPGVGEAADLAVAQAVEDQGEELAGRGDAGDVAARAARRCAGSRSRSRRRRGTGDRLDRRPAHQPGALLGDRPAADLGVGLAVRGASARPTSTAARASGTGRRRRSRRRTRAARTGPDAAGAPGSPGSRRGPSSSAAISPSSMAISRS